MLSIRLAQNIRRLRLEQGLTQEELAERFGVTGQAVSRWEREECYPDITLLPGLANLFGVTLDKLMGMEELCGREQLQVVYARANELIGRRRIPRQRNYRSRRYRCSRTNTVLWRAQRRR